MSKIKSNTRKQFIYRNEILIFLILFFISTSIVTYQYSIWETSEERIKHKSLALFTGDEPFYLEMTSSITRFHSFALDAHFTSVEKDPFFEFPPIFYEVHSCRLHHSLMASDTHCYIQNIGLPLIISPGYYLGGAIGAMFTLSLLFSLQGIIFYKIANHFTTKNSGFLLALLVSIGTLLLVFSSRIYPDFLAGFFLLGAIYFFFFREKNFLNIIIVGFFLGFLPFLKLPFLLFSIILFSIMVYVLIKKHHFNNTFQLSLVLSILFLILFSLLVTFAPIEHSIGIGGGYKSHLMDSISSPTASGTQSSLTAISDGLSRHLFGGDYGLLIYSPLALLSIFGIKYIWSYDRYLFFVIVFPVTTYLFFISVFAAYAGGWSLPGRYVLPLLPILLIPLFPLFEKFKKNILLHLIIIFSTYVGVSLNIIFSRTIFSHFYLNERADILNQVYFGLIFLLPSLEYDPHGALITNYLTVTLPPSFLIIIVALISFFIFFSFSPSFKKLFKFKNRKIIFFILIFIVYGTVFYFVYDSTIESFIEPQIFDIYSELLKRQPTSEEVKHWLNLILNDQSSIDELRQNLSQSNEHTLTVKISEIYREILDREPDFPGMLHWKEKILNEEISFSELKNIIKYSPEALN